MISPMAATTTGEPAALPFDIYLQRQQRVNLALALPQSTEVK